MRTFGLISRSFLIVLFLAVAPPGRPAHAVEVYPLTYHFGEVEVGSSSSTVITIVNYTGHSHILTVIELKEGSSPDFTLTDVPDLPFTLESLQELELEVVFTPSAPGLLLADLEIHSVDNSLKIVTVSLQGGPGTAPPPGSCSP
jgi:hypothetical protein